MENNVLRKIPSIQKISESKRFIELCKIFPRHIAINEMRLILDSIRKSNKNNISIDLLLNTLDKNLKELISAQPRKIINMSGVILQTNFGRAPLANYAIKAMSEAGLNYTNLEFDLTTNKRGGRLKKFKNIINRLTNAEDAIVVNNNAAAVFLGLKALCRNKNVLVIL